MKIPEMNINTFLLILNFRDSCETSMFFSFGFFRYRAKKIDDNKNGNKIVSRYTLLKIHVEGIIAKMIDAVKAIAIL